MRSPVLYFFLLVLGVLFNLTLNVVHKYSRFLKSFSKKDLKLVLSKKSSLIIFDLGFMLLLVKADFFFEKQGYKRDTFVIFDFNHF